jgi:aminopeptidase YwaD
VRRSTTFDEARAFEHVRALANLGPRMAGSAADAVARDYIVGALPLAPQQQHFSVITGVIDDARLEVIAPSQSLLPSAPFVLSGPTGEAGVDGAVIWADSPETSDDIAGKIVLWRIGARNDILLDYDAMAARRPSGIVVVWPSAGPLPKHQRISEFTARRGHAPPSFVVRQTDGRELAQRGVTRMRMTMSGAVADSAASNVIAEVVGREAGLVIVVGGHFDTAPGTPGAIDNASGVAATLELARIWALRGARRTIRFVAWGAEKAGMCGSRHYVSALSERELSEHGLCISMDGFGARGGEPVCYPTGDDVLIAAASRACGADDVRVSLRSGFYGSDSEMFVQAGVPALSFGQEGPGVSLLHTAADTIDAMDMDQLGRVGRAVDAFLSEADEAEHWLFARTVSPDARDEAARILSRMNWL